MTNKKSFWIFLLICFGLILNNSCKKDNNNPSNTVTDKDGNVYHTVTIGTQVWMVENLKTTKYNDGTDIPNVTDATAWAALTTPAYCWYNNDKATNKNTYGALYNWYTVNTGKLAPIGWHVPSDAEWTTLMTYLGGGNMAGGKLKEIGTLNWTTPNTGADNSSGFTALPGGERFTGQFTSLGIYGCWMSSSEISSNQIWYMYLYYSVSDMWSGGHPEDSGFSVRCIRD
jgi:uncharacterized protein (TIGR02145 family)